MVEAFQKSGAEVKTLRPTKNHFEESFPALENRLLLPKKNAPLDLEQSIFDFIPGQTKLNPARLMNHFKLLSGINKLGNDGLI